MSFENEVEAGVQEATVSVGIFYGSTYGNTQDAAEKLGNLLQEAPGLSVQVHDISYSKPAELLEYSVLLIGCSTWNTGELQDDWGDKFGALDSLDLNGKLAGVFGMGDQIGYSDTFCDALGELAEKLEERGATLVGAWPTAGYGHVLSRADRGDGYFVGLALDWDNESDLTESRLAAWSSQLLAEIQGRLPVLKSLV